MTITKDNTCNCEYTTNPEGFQVCRWCGLFNEDYQEMTGTHINLFEEKYFGLKKEYNNSIYGAINHTNDGFETLGSLIESKQGGFIDHRHRSVSERHKFTRLLSYKYFEYNNKERVDIRVINNGKRVCKALHLPKYIVSGSFYRYKKILKNTRVVNGTLCLFYCIWETTRWFKYKIPLNKIIEVHQERGHFVNARRLNKAAGEYREILRNEGIPITLPLNNRDYIDFYANILLENHEIWKASLNFYKINIESYQFVNEVIKLAYEMYDTLNDKGLIQGGNPKIISAATLYSACVVYTKRFTGFSRKSVFTQIRLGKLLKVSSESIKKYYILLYKPFIMK